MTHNTFKPTLYSKKGCPFSFKVTLFLLESGLIDKFNLIEMDPAADEAASIREKLETATGQPASFPTVEVAPGDFWTESDDVIKKYADELGLSVDEMTVLNNYKSGVFSKYITMVKKIKVELPDFFDQLAGRKPA